MNPKHVCAKSRQLCLTLCDPVDCSLSGSPVHEIFQARILEWVAISFSGGSSQPRDQTRISCVSCINRQFLYHQRHVGSPNESPRSAQFGNAHSVCRNMKYLTEDGNEHTPSLLKHEMPLVSKGPVCHPGPSSLSQS